MISSFQVIYLSSLQASSRSVARLAPFPDAAYADIVGARLRLLSARRLSGRNTACVGSNNVWAQGAHVVVLRADGGGQGGEGAQGGAERRAVRLAADVDVRHPRQGMRVRRLGARQRLRRNGRG